MNSVVMQKSRAKLDPYLLHHLPRLNCAGWRITKKRVRRVFMPLHSPMIGSRGNYKGAKIFRNYLPIEAMLRVRPDMKKLADKEISIFCIGAALPEATIRVRSFAPALGVTEDPVTGSSNGCIAALIAKYSLLPVRDGELTYVAEQGIEMGQPGRVHLRVTGAPDRVSVQVGGNAVTVLRGELLLPD